MVQVPSCVQQAPRSLPAELRLADCTCLVLVEGVGRMRGAGAAGPRLPVGEHTDIRSHRLSLGTTSGFHEDEATHKTMCQACPPRGRIVHTDSAPSSRIFHAQPAMPPKKPTPASRQASAQSAGAEGWSEMGRGVSH